MGNKRRPSAHQRQVRFFAILFGTIMVLVVAVCMYYFNRMQMPAH